MGVTGLWTVLQPCARPIKLETLNKKRLAVDASIWIYQFLKAVRDKEGNALRNSHIVGFFRRICKLLYFGIKPVFVFDGGAPTLKRQTIAARKKRREGRREDATRTAGKLLAVQMQRTAEEEAEARRQRRNRPSGAEELVPEAPVYADEALMTEQEKQRNRKFKKKDQYHLPNLDVSLEEMGAPNDPRIMSQEELEEYARQFHRGQDINLYDFSKIDFDGPFFLSLPATDRYNILNAARLRSRLRMGYSKEQLDTMFPDRMAFSRFQIERVAERNDLTQRLMNINGMNGEDAFYKSGQRIAGERGREYVLVKDSQNEGGWVLGVVGNKDAGRENKPIDVDQYGQPEQISDSDDVSDDDEFEDVPIEGINRLPKLPFLQKGVFDDSLQHAREDMDMQKVLFESRQFPPLPAPRRIDDNALFVNDDRNTAPLPNRRDSDVFEGDSDSDLERAIALSLQPTKEADDDMPDLSINRDTVHASAPDISQSYISDNSEDDMDFSAAVAQTKITKKQKPVVENPFSGPLPFESISLGKLDSVKEKFEKADQLDDDAGGFLKHSDEAKKKIEPLPPWFAGSKVSDEFIAEPTFEENKDQDETDNLVVFPKKRTPDVIDVDEAPRSTEVIDLEADGYANGHANNLENIDHIETSLIKEQEKSVLKLDIRSPESPGVTEKDTVGDVPQMALKAEAKSTVVFQEDEDKDAVRSGSPQAEASPQPEFEDVVPPSPPPIHVSARPSQPSSAALAAADMPSGTDLTPQLDDTEAVPFDHDDNEFSDPEDEDLMRQLAAEGEEHVRFAQTLNSDTILNQVNYEQELKQLRNQQRKDRRDADEVTQIMINECQQLLRLFGLPYVTAPMEAEAQCAELVTLGLVDGIVTDDSDTFLFGGTRVYKNMFNQSKFVECYLSSDLEKEFALHRQKLISFAHLLGSDYTEGIPGIGPVKALEIITEFPNLADFREWWADLQMGVSKPDDTHAAFRKKFRKQASKIFLPPTFPDTRVDTAYLEPEVDSDPSPFQWGVPDLNGLRNFLMATIGWSQERTDEVLVPVIRDMNRRAQEGTQSNITQFMQGSLGAGAFAPRVRSGGPSRMERAFGRLRQEARGHDASSPDEPISAAIESPGNAGDAIEAEAGQEPTSSKRAATSHATTRGTRKKRKTRGAPSST
ncbi:DNA repair protein rad13 [Penicillium diatomitis]|uniref:DNA repair protein rad13 n=1 Tax=Penicillium diatomitis TaxID=2819901 RepID=A0A9W9XHM8_9EURO|nr:DNA repair protein rad13 [Penicillium diatomitis]KAJ5492795.1 DNA repair protein rad13 [Penicillium diatomitis]